jgi:rubredoxin
MQKWECPCGYIYDPENGDPDNGVSPGTEWENVAKSWVCPLCGAERESFSPIE